MRCPGLCLLVVVATIAACDSEYDAMSAARYDCIYRVCEVLPACSPMIPGASGWDWRTATACRQTMTCGDDFDACERAVEQLLCVGPGPTPWLTEGHIEGVNAVKAACRYVRPSHGARGGGRIHGRWKPQ